MVVIGAFAFAVLVGGIDGEEIGVIFVGVVGMVVGGI